MCCSVLQCVAVCCSVLQCVAVCCSRHSSCATICRSVLQWVVECCSALQCVAAAIYCSYAIIHPSRVCVDQCVCVCVCVCILQRVAAIKQSILNTCQLAIVEKMQMSTYAATYCNILQHTATYCNTLQHTATHRNTRQHTATYCNTLQHTATIQMSSIHRERNV